jgi:hypothetical protein
MSLAFTSIKKNNINPEKVNKSKNSLHTLLGDINGLGDKKIFDDPLINSRQSPIRVRKKLRRNSKYPNYHNLEDYQDSEHQCNGCFAYSDMIKFYHKLLLIIIIGLLLKFVLDTLVNKNIY